MCQASEREQAEESKQISSQMDEKMEELKQSSFIVPSSCLPDIMAQNQERFADYHMKSISNSMLQNKK